MCEFDPMHCDCHEWAQPNAPRKSDMDEARRRLAPQPSAPQALTEEESARWDRAVESGEAVERLQQIRPEPIIEAAWQAGYDQAKAEVMLAQPSAPQALDDRLRYDPTTGDSDFEDAPLSDRLDAIEQAAWSKGFGEGYRSTPQALDVERLERAMHAILPHLHGPDEAVPNPYYAQQAERIAAEYARLSRLPSEE